MKTLEKKDLFWDVGDVDSQKHKKFIIERVLSFGDIDDVYWAMEFYGKDQLKKVVEKTRKLDKKSANFWCHYFNINKEEWKKNQLVWTQSAFWRR
jgi:hypothetical protein